MAYGSGSEDGQSLEPRCHEYRMVREFKEYRPWNAKAQFDKEIAKYVGARETARLWRYVVIQ